MSAYPVVDEEGRVNAAEARKLREYGEEVMALVRKVAVLLDAASPRALEASSIRREELDHLAYASGLLIGAMGRRLGQIREGRP